MAEAVREERVWLGLRRQEGLVSFHFNYEHTDGVEKELGQGKG